MSTRKQSAPGSLQRSRSSSSIPLLNRQSRLPLRNSMQKNWAKTLNRPGLEKRSLDRNLTRSHSNLNEAPRFSRQRSGSLVRSSMMTPLNQNAPCSSRKSPLLSSVRKDNRPITDKRWQYEQIVKVRNFVVREFPHLDHNNIKSGMPLDLFVCLINSFFQQIDRRINITRENYIDEVPSHLKRIRYPTTVKPSLMKTVNAPHSWAQVLAILSWLTDTVTEINAPVVVTNPLMDIVDNCMMQLYHYWNIGEDDEETIDAVVKEMDKQLVEELNIDEEEIKKLDDEIEGLKQQKLSYEQKQQDNENKMEELRKKIEELNSKCDVFEAQNQEYENKVKDRQTAYTRKIKKMDQELAELTTTETHLKNIVANQPHTRVEKEQLKEKIESLQNTLKLKEERCQKLRELIASYDFQLSDLKQKVEAQAYEYNNVINKLELINPKLKNLCIRESGFVRLDTEEELKEVTRLLNLATTKAEEDLKQLKVIFEAFLKKNKKIDEELTVEEKKLQELIQADAELTLKYEHNKRKTTEKRERALTELNERRNNLIELKNSRFDLAPLKQKVEELGKQNKDLLEFKEDLKTRALEFFIKLEAQVSSNLENYMQIMTNLSKGLKQTQGAYVKDSKERIEYLEKANGNYEEQLMKIKES